MDESCSQQPKSKNKGAVRLQAKQVVLMVEVKLKHRCPGRPTAMT